MFELVLSLYHEAESLVDRDFLEDFRRRLGRIIERVFVGYKRVSACHRVVMEIWRILSEGGESGDFVRRRLLAYVNSLRYSDCPIRGFLSRLKRLVKRWSWGLFTTYDDPVIPRTNQRLESFNARVRIFARVVTRGRNAERYEVSRGALYCFVLGDFDVSVGDVSVYYVEGVRVLGELKGLLREFAVDPRVRLGILRRFLSGSSHGSSLIVGVDRYLKDVINDIKGNKNI